MAWLAACNSKMDNTSSFKLETAWKYDSATGDSVILLFDSEFNNIVDMHLALIQKDQVPEFMYNVYLDTIYEGYNLEGSHGRSVRAAIISQMSHRDLLELMLRDSKA